MHEGPLIATQLVRDAADTRVMSHDRFPAYANANNELGRYPVGIVRTKEQNTVCFSLSRCIRG